MEECDKKEIEFIQAKESPAETKQETINLKELIGGNN